MYDFIRAGQFLIEIINWTSPLLAGNFCSELHRKKSIAQIRKKLYFIWNQSQLSFLGKHNFSNLEKLVVLLLKMV